MPIGLIPLSGRRGAKMRIQMPPWLMIVLALLAYLILMKWLLPRLGVPT